MGSILMRILLFLSSYFPLTVIFFIQLFPEQKAMAFIMVGIGILGLLGMIIYVRTVKSLASIPLTVTSISRKGSETMSYIFSYLLPFMAVPWDKPKEALSLGIIFGVLGIIYINSNMIHVNPMLYAFGYKLYEIENENGEVFSLLTRGRVCKRQRLSVVKVGEEILIDTGAES